MLEKNSLLYGLLLAIIVPVVVFIALYGLYEVLESFGWVSDRGFRPMFRERTTGIVAIFANAFLLNSFHKKRLHNTVRGIVIVTTFWMALWVIRYAKYVL